MYNLLKMLRPVILLLGFSMAGYAGAQTQPVFIAEGLAQPSPSVVTTGVAIASRYARPIDWRKYMSAKIKPVAIYRHIHFPPESMALAALKAKEPTYNELSSGTHSSSTSGVL